MRRSFCNRLPGISRPLSGQPVIPAYIDTALVKPRATLSPTETVKRMADDMRSSDSVTDLDLEAKGYTRAQIKTHGADARQLAQQLAGASL
jgi:hypothetical protein